MFVLWIGHFAADADGMEIARLTVVTAAWQCRGYSGAPNTDCVDLSGSNIHVKDSLCHNGDDCWPLLPSFSNYSARGSAPPPPGVDQAGLTANVLIENCVCQCGNGVRVMPGIGAPQFGLIENITYREFELLATYPFKTYHDVHARPLERATNMCRGAL